jgi:hypothetical protein
MRLKAEVVQQLHSVEDIRAQLRARGVDIDHIFERPSIPKPGQQMQPRRTDEDDLQREPEAFNATLNSDNPYSPRRRPEPYTPGEPIAGEQLAFSWPSTVPPDACCWPAKRPLRVVSSNNPEGLIDDQERAPPPAAE